MTLCSLLSPVGLSLDLVGAVLCAVGQAKLGGGVTAIFRALHESEEPGLLGPVITPVLFERISKATTRHLKAVACSRRVTSGGWILLISGFTLQVVHAYLSQ